MKTPHSVVGAIFRIASLLIPLFGNASVSSTTTNLDIHHDPLIRFDFQESKCVNDTFFSNVGSLSSMGDLSLVRNTSITAFSEGNLGLESLPPLYIGTASSYLHGPTKPLLTVLQEEEKSAATSGSAEKGISIGLWLRSLDNNEDQSSTILTVGRAGPLERQYIDPNGITECDRRHIDLQLILQKGRSLTLVYRTSDPFFEPCQRLHFRDIALPPDELAYVTIVLAHQHQQLFVNGQPSEIIMEEPFDSSLAHWSRSGHLQLFSYQRQTPWQGQIHRLEIHQSSSVWDQEDVRSIMSKGLPPTLPYASAATHRIFEDAEIQPGSHSTEWYEHPNTFDVKKENERVFPELPLPIHFLDKEVESLLESLGIQDYTRAPEVFTYISKLPSRGSLYRGDGLKLSTTTTGSVSHIVPLQRQSMVVFIPDHNTYSSLPGSTYTSIEYCVALQEIIASSQCISTARINIVVDSVNDPPVALIGSAVPYQVQEGIVEARLPLQLKGSDVDQGDLIAGFEIVTPPRLGYLYLSVPVRREDGLFHGTLLSDLNFVIPGTEALVEYRFNDTRSLVRDRVVSDSFDFRVQDSHGSWSVPMAVQIQVVSGLTSASFLQPQSLVAQEDSVAYVPLKGLDQSGLNRSIGFFLESVPDPEDAIVFENGDNDSVLPSGTLLDSRSVSNLNEEGPGILFAPAASFCKAKKTATSSIGYRVVAYDADDRISSISGVIDQYITVQCKIKPIVLSLSQVNFTTRVFTGLMDDPCSGYVYNASTRAIIDGTTCESAVILENAIHIISDSATHTDRALVSIRCNHGRLTLNQKHRSQIRLLEGQAVMRPAIKFLALPRDLDDILAHLHFQSQIVGPDDIRISIHYGDCPETNNTMAHDPFQCFSIHQSIHIEVLPAVPIEKEMMFDTFPWIPLPFTLTMILLVKFKGKLRVILAIRKSETNDHDDDEDTTGTSTVADTTLIRWKQFHDDSTGFFYYLNFDDGTVTWDPPLDEEFIPCEEFRSS